jgi:hypothetical protein
MMSIDATKHSKHMTVEYLLNQSSGYDDYRCHVILCIVVTVTSVDVMHVSNYSIEI